MADVVEGCIDIAQEEANDATVHQRPRGRLQRDGVIIGIIRVLHKVDVEKDIAEVEVGLGQFRINGDRRLEIFNRLLRVALFVMGQPTIVVRFRHLWRQRHGLIKVRNRRARAGLPVDSASPG